MRVFLHDVTHFHDVKLLRNVNDNEYRYLENWLMFESLLALENRKMLLMSSIARSHDRRPYNNCKVYGMPCKDLRKKDYREHIRTRVSDQDKMERMKYCGERKPMEMVECPDEQHLSCHPPCFQSPGAPGQTDRQT